MIIETLVESSDELGTGLHVEHFENCSGLRFVWIGDGDLDTALSGHPLPDNLHITGWLSYADSLRTMASAEIFLNTALWEGLSRTCLEAAALRLPLLLRPVDGTRELIPEQGTRGYLCESKEEFESRIRALAADDTLRSRMGIEARRMVEKHYNSTNSNQLWREIYLSGALGSMD